MMVVLLMNSACGVISGFLATSTPTPTLTYTPTFTPTQTSTPTPSPTPSPIPTNTPTPTVTFTPSPTPTPMGYYYNENFQFSLILPPDWTAAENSSYIQFWDPYHSLFLQAQNMDFNVGSGMDIFLNMLVNMFRSPDLNLFASSSLGNKDEVILGDGTIARRQVISGKSPSGENLIIQITCAHNVSKLYAFIFVGSDIVIEASENLINGIYETITLGENDLVTIPPSNTDTIAGEWTGTAVGIDDPSFSTQIDLSIDEGCTVGKLCGTVSAPDFPCNGDIALESIIGNTYNFIEQNMQGSSSCFSGAFEYIRLLPDDTLSWQFSYITYSGEQTGSSAILNHK
jgi:hypothetical protein